jgi:thiol-disulfide isomerase/thioredoxin
MYHPRSWRSWPFLATLAVALAAGAAVAPAQQPQPIRDGFDGAVDWINVAGPIKLEDLRGKVVLLDFWTYCCINCHHVIPDLEYLEQKYPNELVVIGVHSPKFDAERETENIRKKVTEYRIKHPVINDAKQILWERFGVQSWPTLVLIDPAGRYVGSLSGEGHRAVLDRAVGELVAEAKAKGELDETPLHFPAEVYKAPTGPLLFPGKILVDAAGKRLFISDTGHNRVVVTDVDGNGLFTIGDGEAELKDGAFEAASFNRPQGMCLVGDTLYVADVENHAIRACDLESKTVKTVAGTGKQQYRRSGGGKASEIGLNSPWDLVRVPNTSVLLVAMAGPHQIWRLDLERGEIGVWAGTGSEDIEDGPIDEAAFAQPSGLATDGKYLYVADSEGSAIRAVNLDRPHRVVTIAGSHDYPQGQSLFQFGDKDGRGKGGSVRLQHCLGVSYLDGTLYVADSYNNKIKAIDLKTTDVRTVAGTRQAGSLDDPAQFNEPGGLSAAGSNVFIADTNNHEIRIYSTSSKKVSTLAIKGVEAPRPKARKPRFLNAKAVDVPGVEVKPGSQFSLKVDLAIPEGFKPNPEAPTVVLLESSDPSALGSAVPETGLKLDPPKESFVVKVPLAKPAEAGQSLELTLSVQSFECKEGAAGYCAVKSFIWKVPVTFAEGGVSEVELSAKDARK